MKPLAFILVAALLSAAVMLAPTGAAGCENRPGYTSCEYQVSAGDAHCDAGYRYYYHDAFYAFQAGCGVGPKYVGFSTYP